MSSNKKKEISHNNTRKKYFRGGIGEQQPQPIPLGQLMVQPPPIQPQQAYNNQIVAPAPQMGAPEPQLGDQYQQMGAPEPQLGNQYQQMGAPEQQLGDQYQQMGAPEPQLGDQYQQSGDQESQLGNQYPESGYEEPQLGEQYPESGDQTGELGYEEPQLAYQIEEPNNQEVIESEKVVPIEKEKTPVEELLPNKPIEESAELAEFRKMMEDHENKRDYFYVNSNISTELNKDKTYKREGVLHFTDSVGINAIRSGLTAIGNLFGSKGIENVMYDKLRNTALQKVGILLGDDRRCYNTRMDFERFNDTLFIHIYGTVYVKK